MGIRETPFVEIKGNISFIFFDLLKFSLILKHESNSDHQTKIY